MIVYNGDTLVAITKEQRDYINIVKIEHDYYKEYSDSLKSVLGDTKVALIDAKNLNKHLEKEIHLNGKLNKEQKKFIRDLAKDLRDQNVRLKKVLKINLGLWVYSGTTTLLLLLILI